MPNDMKPPLMIGGIGVEFPYPPYPSQLAMAHKIICCLKAGQHCILESPTGSGKTLALLCGALAWQKSEYEKLQDDLLRELSQPILSSTSYGPPEQTIRGCDMPQGSVISQTAANSTILGSSTAIAVSVSPLDVICLSDSDDAEDFQKPKRFKTCAGMADPLQNQILGDINSSAAPADSNAYVSANNDTFQQPVFRKIPKIFYGTRTHKQVTQIIRELRKTVYKNTKMCILGSREVTCIHPVVSQEINKNEACKNLLLTGHLEVEGNYLHGESASNQSLRNAGCKYYRRAEVISTHQGLAAAGLSSAWDIEDLVSVGRKRQACPYFATRELKTDADIIFCPYNYLINPLVRESLDIVLRGHIVILDEAHNIEDTSRSAASYEVKDYELFDLLTALDIGAQEFADDLGQRYMMLAQMVSRLYKWLKLQSDKLSSQSNSSFETSSKIFSGTEMIAELSDLNIGPNDFLNLKNCYEALKNGMEDEEAISEERFSSAGLMLLSGFFMVLDYLFKNNLTHAEDYQIAILKSISYDQRTNVNSHKSAWLTSRRSFSSDWVVSLNFWCLNPAVAFNAIKENVRSIVLTSGTLSPLKSFQSELGVEFSNMLETDHVVKQAQMWVGTISNGPSSYSLNACFGNTEKYEYQDEVGNAVLAICKIIPHGVLCFVPSYSLLNKLTLRWKDNGLWQRIHFSKRIVVEPRKKDDFLCAMMEFYRSVDESVAGNSSECQGALFLAVCRGKVSEGLDFADNYARAVITIGIPFPNVSDLQVKLKRDYNNRYHRQRGFLPGNVWYEVQAYRALNQALGRCIRHKNDWGAIILLDDRFCKNPRNTDGLSKWVRNALQHYQQFSPSMTSLKSFVELQQTNPSFTCLPEDSHGVSSTGPTAKACRRVKVLKPKDLMFMEGTP